MIRTTLIALFRMKSNTPTVTKKQTYGVSMDWFIDSRKHEKNSLFDWKQKKQEDSQIRREVLS